MVNLDASALKEIGMMRSLISRIEKPHTLMEAMQERDRMISESVQRECKNPSEIFDVLDSIGENSFVNIGYVSAANIDIPQVKKRNPLTNRMKNYDDYVTFGNQIGYSGEDEIGAVVSLTNYNFRYNSSSRMKGLHAEYRDKFNALRGEYGLPPVASKSNEYRQNIDYGRGFKAYGGDNDELNGHAYTEQNMYKGHITSTTYLVGKDGHILKSSENGESVNYVVDKDTLAPFLKKKGTISGVKGLREMGATDDVIQEYIRKEKELKFRYKQFEFGSILYICATVNGQKILYLNDNLKRTIGGIDINPGDFLEIAREKYKEALADANNQI